MYTLEIFYVVYAYIYSEICILHNIIIMMLK